MAQLVGDVVDSVWGDITTNWESTSTVWTTSLTGSVSFWQHFDTPTKEKVVVSRIRAVGRIRLRLLVRLELLLTRAARLVQQQIRFFAQLVDRIITAMGYLAYVDDNSASQSITAGK